MLCDICPETLVFKIHVTFKWRKFLDGHTMFSHTYFGCWGRSPGN